MNTKNKAFTLVEMMGIIVILVMIALVAVPSIIRMSKNTENTRYENYKKDVVMATQTYIELNIDSYTTLKTVGETVDIQVKTLMSEGYINNDIKNPKTKESPSDNEIVRITVNGNKSLSYDYIITP